MTNNSQPIDDGSLLPPVPTINREMAVAQGKKGGISKIVAGVIGALTTSYIMNQFSLHGVNFEIGQVMPGLTITSEFVKSSIEGAIVGALVGLTPSHFIATLRDGILFVRASVRTIWDAIVYGK